jgi:CheY-like chemotaxis protein
MPKRLLLADDSITTQKVVALTFAREDVEVEAIADGARALERAKSLRPDIVLADVSMPGLSGYELCERIRGNPQLAETPVVLLVGSFEPFDEVEATRVGCNGYLTKPFDTSELIGTVRTMIDEAAQKRQTAAPGSIAAVAGGYAMHRTPAVPLVSARTRESFLGSNPILDLFGCVPAPDRGAPETAIQGSRDTPPEAASHIRMRGAARLQPEKAESKPKAQSAQAMHVIPFPGMRANSPDLGPAWLSEDLVDTIVERVVRRMSQDVVREVAWEVVPEMAEMIIRDVLKDQAKPTES